MNWNKLENTEQLNAIDEESKDKKVLILKHSTRCAISASVLNRLERKWAESNDEKIKPYYLNVLVDRNISNEISLRYKVTHESPQLLLIENGNCIYNASHYEINYDEIMQLI